MIEENEMEQARERPLASRQMGRLMSLGRYVRDVSEVLVLNRLHSSPLQETMAGEAATHVRQARFHAHARIPNLDLSEIVSRLSADPVTAVTLPGPREFFGVGNATYYHALGSLVRALAPSSALEFGTYLGVGTLTIALNAPDGCRIATVDLPDQPFQQQSHGLNDADLALIDASRERVGEAFLQAGLGDRIHQIRADSLTWGPDPSLGPIDFALIDGGHSTAVVKADTENVLRLLSDDGTIIWDDYFHLYPDVVDYLESVAADGRPLYAIRRTNMVIYNPRLS
jgi:predicted O-methyltransferase YrrM